MRRGLAGALALIAMGCGGVAWGFGPFHDRIAGPLALPGDRLPPFAMLGEDGKIALEPPPLPPGVALPQPGGPPESTAPGPGLDQSLRMARAAVQACGKAGFRVGVAVVDSLGEARAMITADGADGSHVYVGQRKAIVALAFDQPSSQANLLLRHDSSQMGKVTPAMFVEGGAVPIRRGGKLIGAIGDSGAAGIPIGHQDEVCAIAGLRAGEAKGR